MKRNFKGIVNVLFFAPIKKLLELLLDITYLLQLWDGIWSVPMSILLFLSIEIAGRMYLSDGDSLGFYDPAFIQAAFLASIYMVLFNFIAWVGMFFNFRSVYFYYLKDSKNDFKNLLPWQKLSFLLFLYCFFVVLMLIMTMRLV